MAAMRILPFRRWLPLVCVMLLALGCQRAQRYPASKPDAALAEKAAPLPSHWSWLAVQETRDVPIRFVLSTKPNEPFWTRFPAPPLGLPTLHLGQPPLNLVAMWAMVEPAEQVTIRVPFGLPDPTAMIPAANPPTLGKWMLGRKIFHAPLLKAQGDVYACATCHDPAQGFTQPIARTVGAVFNAPSLLNVVYRRHLFWDGRVSHLEETIVRTLEDERQPREQRRDESPLATHRWGGLVNALDRDPEMKAEFAQVFGVTMPTQDAIAKALATYLRTLLAGDSLIDRAEYEAKGAKPLRAEHFEAALTKDALANLKQADKRPGDVAKLLAEGQQLFHGKARCSQCHAGPLYTDHDFHNVGFDENSLSAPGKESGRFAQAPIGLKEDRLIGAYRTASLRALPRTGPYFHHGRHQNLRQAVIHYDRSIVAPYIGPHLAHALRDGDNAQSLHLTSEETDALVLFLEALDGAPLPAILQGKR